VVYKAFVERTFRRLMALHTYELMDTIVSFGAFALLGSESFSGFA
jgi:hypothetical protein